MGIALRAEDVAIRYITGDFKDIGLKEYITRRITGKYHVKEFMAVDDVSFELHEGDMLGIVGANGAGKSTLLKAVAGIMAPTRGKITANGEVAALLELGSGFDGDLTVKENAYLRGAMLGYTKDFMDQTYERIIDFAELKEFEDRPFKQLSSGMKSRLAFSIASLVKPDILILDEVLSVGDGAFQKKSAEKMREIISQGATTILVSHSLEQIRELCNKVLWLDHGRQIAFGETQEICDRYEKYLQGDCPIETAPEGIDSAHITEPNTVQKKIRIPRVAVNAEVGENQDKTQLPGQTRSIQRVSLRHVAVSLLLALFCALLAFYAGNRCFGKGQESQVMIRAQAGTGAVTFRGAYVNGEWVSPADHVREYGNWVYDEKQAVYTAADQTQLVFSLPAGAERKLIFTSGPNEGVADVEVDGGTYTFDLKDEELWELGLPYDVAATEKYGISSYSKILALAVFLLAFLICTVQRENETDIFNPKREVWIDALKVLSAGMVVLIHSSGSLYNNSFGADRSLWLQGLFANAVPRFAVPCFLMITGAFSLTKEWNLRRVKKSALHVLTPLVFWSALHVTANNLHNVGGLLSGLARIPFSNQDGSLWYAYQLIWLYLGMPFWSILWKQLSQKQRYGFTIFALLIPGVLTQIEELLHWNVHEYLPFGSIDPMICYVGILFLGRLLYEFVTTKPSQKCFRIGFTSALAGLTLMAFSSVYVSNIAQESVHTFFSESRLPAILLGTGVFLCMGCARNALNNISAGLRRAITELSSVSIGVYMSHNLIIYKILPDTIQGMGITLNRYASLGQLLACAFFFYAVSVSMCLVMAKAPGIRRLVT